MKRRFWIALLAASLLGNTYLWCTRTAPGAKPALPDPPRRTPYTMPELKLPKRERAIPASYADLDRAQLEQRLAETQARISENLLPTERVKIGERSMEDEAKVRPLLDQLFKRYEGKEPKFSLECRSGACKVESSLNNVWWVELQDLAPGRELFGTMGFTSMPDGVPKAFLELTSRQMSDERLFMTIVFGAREDIVACGARSTVAFLVVRLAVAHPTMRVTVEGPVATAPFGVCVKKAIEDQIARSYVSPTLTFADKPYPLTFPWREREE